MAAILVMWKCMLCILCTLWPLELQWDKQQSSSDSLDAKWNALRLQRISVTFYTSSERPSLTIPLHRCPMGCKTSTAFLLNWNDTCKRLEIVTFSEDLWNNIITVFNNPNWRKVTFLFFFPSKNWSFSNCFCFVAK